jgi:DNA-binding LacI/PurR family transcriptional regulator
VVETLASLGHRRVAYIYCEPAFLPIRQRLTALRRFSKKQCLESEEALFERGPLSAAGGYEACRRLWTSIKKKPSALVAFSDTVAVGALRFLHEQNLHIPADVSVIGFDGIAIGNFTCVSLSTISTPMYEIGKQAFELLVSSMYKNSGLPQSMILPVRLVLRESVGPAPAGSKS